MTDKARELLRPLLDIAVHAERNVIARPFNSQPLIDYIEELERKAQAYDALQSQCYQLPRDPETYGN